MLSSQVMLQHLESRGARPVHGFEHQEIEPKPLLRQPHLLEP